MERAENDSSAGAWQRMQQYYKRKGLRAARLDAAEKRITLRKLFLTQEKVRWTVRKQLEAVQKEEVKNFSFSESFSIDRKRKKEKMLLRGTRTRRKIYLQQNQNTWP